MSTASSDRLPFEIWEQILEESISFPNDMTFQATCSPATYLAFQETCGSSSIFPSRSLVSYGESEVTRKKLRLVCRAWKTFADDWKRQDRWVRLSVDLGYSKSDSATCTIPKRLDIITYAKNYPPPGWMPEDDTWLQVWCNREAVKKRSTRLTRFEMMHPNIGPHRYARILQGLCNASSQISGLRSLAITMPLHNARDIDIISGCFPHLTHLTLETGHSGLLLPSLHTPDGYRSTAQIGEPRLDKLEALLLTISRGCFDITKWMVPRLHTLRVTPVSFYWNTHIYPFLQSNGIQIETLDLEDIKSTPLLADLAGRRTPYCLPIDFWELVPHLRLFRIDLRVNAGIGFPKRDHPLEWLVHTDWIHSPEAFVAVLDEWAGYRGEGRSRKIVLDGLYLDRINPADLGGKVGDVLKGLKNNGTVLTDVNGNWLPRTTLGLFMR